MNSIAKDCATVGITIQNPYANFVIKFLLIILLKKDCIAAKFVLIEQELILEKISAKNVEKYLHSLLKIEIINFVLKFVIFNPNK